MRCVSDRVTLLMIYDVNAFRDTLWIGVALTDPPSLFGEIARMIKTISPGSNFPDTGRKYEGIDSLIN